MTITEIKHDVKYWQRLLRLAGYYTGKIDGIRGKLQASAEQKWESEAAAAKEQYGEFDARTEANIATLLPSAQASARQWLKKAQAFLDSSGLTIRIIQGTRSYSEQDALYNKRPRVTNARGGYSMHNFGIAFDVGIFRDGKYLDDVSKTADAQYCAVHAACGNPAGMQWGGDWKSIVDYPHYQLSKWGSSTAQLRSIF